MISYLASVEANDPIAMILVPGRAVLHRILQVLPYGKRMASPLTG